MTDFLYFRQSIEKMKGGQLLFAVFRLREEVSWAFDRLEKKTPLDIPASAKVKYPQGGTTLHGQRCESAIKLRTPSEEGVLIFGTSRYF